MISSLRISSFLFSLSAFMPIFVKANSIRVSKSCFTVGEDIDITFVNSSPQMGDFIGFYSPDVTLSSLPSPLGIRWIWTCGTRSCTDTTGIFSATVTYFSTIEVGSWKVALARDDGQGSPYTGVVQSSTFVIRSTCSASTRTPTRSPAVITTRVPTRPPAVSSTRTPTRVPVTSITRAPTRVPVTSTTRTPTRVPTSTQTSSVTTNKQSYAIGEKILVTFRDGVIIDGDWIGIYPASTSSTNLREPTLFVWTCGSQTCTTSPGSGTVTLQASSVWNGGIWPLAAGSSWKAYLLRDDIVNSNGGTVAVAASVTFTITSGNSGAGVTATALSAAREDIKALIIGQGGNKRLGPMFLRLAFHDCIGGCDGCVDLTNPENAGLLTPIQALRPVVAAHANSLTNLTRADVWALSAAVGADVLQTAIRVDFNFLSVGRVNCENANTICRNEQGVQHACSDIRGPHRVVPGMNINSRDLFDFFATQFGFSIKESVALMGAHTVGQLRKEEVGVDGLNGWKLENEVFDNGYYAELVGGTSASDPRDTHINDAPGWQRNVETNNPNGIPDRNIWTGFPNGKKIIMTNPDIGLVRELDSTNMDANGKVNCTFRRTGACPVNLRSIQFAIDYTFDIRLWLNDFQAVLLRMLNNKYTRTTKCDGAVCFLRPI